MTYYIFLFSVSILLHVLRDTLASGFYQSIHAVTFQDDVLKEIEDLSHLQCLHHCRLTPHCKNVAIGTDGTCLLLKESGGNGKEIETRRISHLKLPPKKIPPPGKQLKIIVANRGLCMTQI